MTRNIKVIFSENAMEVFSYLNREASSSKVEKSILRAIRQKTELIKHNAHYGNNLPKRLIPKEIIKKYEVTNLYRIELPNF